MRIVILSCGSRGDAQPCIALAQGLTDHGHDVTLAASPNHKALVEEAGIQFEPIGTDTQAILARYKEGGANMAEDIATLYTKVQYDAW